MHQGTTIRIESIDGGGVFTTTSCLPLYGGPYAERP
jgi:hypothetical protein